MVAAELAEESAARSARQRRLGLSLCFFFLFCFVCFVFVLFCFGLLVCFLGGELEFRVLGMMRVLNCFLGRFGVDLESKLSSFMGLKNDQPPERTARFGSCGDRLPGKSHAPALR